MSRFVNPQVAVFRGQLSGPTLFIQVLLTPRSTALELRHTDDSARSLVDLRSLSLADLEPLAELTEGGAFRPNKAAPTLRRGWQCSVGTDAELSLALEYLYPGALADWFARHTGTARATSFREFMVRQTGRYRSTQNLTDAQADEVTRAGCEARFCRRQRLWNSPGLGADLAENRSLVPCFEPCALLLEFARRTTRLAREETFALPVTVSDLEALEAALAHVLDHPRPTDREGDTRNPANPRRLQYLLHQLQSVRGNTETKNDA